MKLNVISNKTQLSAETGNIDNVEQWYLECLDLQKKVPKMIYFYLIQFLNNLFSKRVLKFKNSITKKVFKILRIGKKETHSYWWRTILLYF